MLSEFPASVVCGRCRGVGAAVSAAHGAAAEADGGRGQRGIHRQRLPAALQPAAVGTQRRAAR